MAKDVLKLLSTTKAVKNRCTKAVKYLSCLKKSENIKNL